MENNSKKVFNNEKYISEKSPIFISLCLEDFFDGLHLDLVVAKEGEEKGGCAVFTINGNPVFQYNMEWLERVHSGDGMLDVQAKVFKDNNCKQ